MRSDNAFNSLYGLGLFIQFIFLGLKLVHVIDWSWWWVYSPSLAIIGITHFMIFMCGIYYIYSAGKTNNDQNRT